MHARMIGSFLRILAASPEGKLWAVDPNLEAAMTRIDDESNKIGATVQPIADYERELAGQLASTMTAEEQAAAAVRLGANADGLDAVATALMALGKPTV